MCGPPGNGSPSSRATLSNASPAASSMVAPSGVDAGGDVLDPQQAGVAAADQHRQARLGQRAVLELVDGDVGGEVVDAVDRLAEPDRQRLGRGDADQQRAGQAGAAGHRDRVDVVQPDAGGLAGPLDGRHHRLEVRPAGHLGHDAAEARVLLDAAGDRVGEQGVAAHDADAGLVAGGLDARAPAVRLTAPLCRAGACNAETGPRMSAVTHVREVAATELAAVSELPFIRHQVDPAATLRAWVRGRAAVVESSRVRPGQTGARPVMTCLGTAGGPGPADGRAGRGRRAPGQVLGRGRVVVDARAGAVGLHPSGPLALDAQRPAVPGPGRAGRGGRRPDRGGRGARRRQPRLLRAARAAPASSAGSGSARPACCWRSAPWPASRRHRPPARGDRPARGPRPRVRAHAEPRPHPPRAGRSLGGRHARVCVENDPAVAIYRGLGYSVVHTLASGPVS